MQKNRQQAVDIIGAAKRIIHQTVYSVKYRKSRFGAMGKGCRIGRNCSLATKNMYLGDCVAIQDRVMLIAADGKLVVKKYSVISASCIIVPGTHLAAPGVPFYYQTMAHYGDESRTITIDEDCWVGAGSILLSKCRLGRGCVVAAGSVVTDEVPPYAVVGGCPARIIAVKFDKDDIIRHESMIYPEAERMTATEIDTLFSKYYTGKKPMQKCGEEEIQRYLRTQGNITRV